MTNTIDLKTLYERLSGVGLSKKYVRQQGLPNWWNEECEQNPGSAIEAAAYISRRLNLDVESLLKPDTTPQFKQTCKPRYKIKSESLPDNLKAAHCIAARIAEMVAYACDTPFKGLIDSPQLIREEILKRWEIVDLERLLNYCWAIGIPVIYFKKFPQSIHKFDGMVAFFGERPVILISHAQGSPAWLLFVLGHEMGHIGKKHLIEASIVDEQIKVESEDNEEIEANEYSAELLIGKPDMVYYTSRYFTGEQLAEYGQKISSRDNVDPGVVILNYAWNKSSISTSEGDKRIIWATASKALKIVEGNINGAQLINSLAHKYLDLDKLDSDSQDYLESILLG